ncbi:hypothetical protein EYS14_01325 [Alteromonadaceae bacterium M269]|nr:hypothetical protein EYS14_01325 [Alteromonadaceae bacterium M269]
MSLFLKLVFLTLLMNLGCAIAMEEIKIETVKEDEFIEYIHQGERPEIQGVIASKETGDEDWYVFVVIAEFIREEPLETKFRKLIFDALNNVEGVKSVEEADREEWSVQGNVDGEELVKACVIALKSIYPELEEFMKAPQ